MTLSLSVSDAHVPDQRLELSVRTPLRSRRGAELPGETPAGQCHVTLSPFNINPDEGVFDSLLNSSFTAFDLKKLKPNWIRTRPRNRPGLDLD